MSEDAKRAAAADTDADTDAATEDPSAPPGIKKPKPAHVLEQAPGEIGGPEGPEPTRYGDWSFKGIASDF